MFQSQVDGEIRQKGSTKDTIFKIPYLISHISSIMTLFEGDVILTGILYASYVKVLFNKASDMIFFQNSIETGSP